MRKSMDGDDDDDRKASSSPMHDPELSCTDEETHGTTDSGQHPQCQQYQQGKDVKRDDEEVQEALAGLQLPHMPSKTALHTHSDQQQSPPTITILVCADIDLKSSSALAEYTLQQKNRVFDASAIDLIIVAGPCARDEDLLTYYRGRQRSSHVRRHQNRHYAGPFTSAAGSETNVALAPFFRSAEESAALEGLVTAALSQLESIVCRVVFCPGYQDPLTTIVPSGSSCKRLTPNSRNVSQQWLPMAPGLGCAGLFYMDMTERLVQQFSSSNRQQQQHHHLSDYGDDETDETDEEEDRRMILSDQLTKLQQSTGPDGYCSTLSKLLKLAPKQDQSILFRSPSDKGQSILITHYMDCRSLLQQGDDSLDDLSDFQEDGYPSAGPEETKETSMPWPRDHDAFLESTLAQHHLCLEIASGSAADHVPALIRKGNGNKKVGPVLLPGSLRQRGEFCIVQLSLVEQAAGEAEQRRAEPLRFAWEVANVDFHRVNDFG